MRATDGLPVYHMAQQVGDDRMAMDEQALFSLTLNSIIDGFVPYEQGRKKAAQRGFAPCHEGRMEERTRTLLALSLNPFSLAGRAVPDLHTFSWIFGLFNQGQIGVRNSVEVVEDSKLAIGWEVDHPLTPQERVLTDAAVECLFDVTRRYIVGELDQAGAVPLHEPLGFGTLRALGLTLNRAHTPGFGLIEVLGERPGIQAEEAARALGCSSRTLQRYLQASGLSLPRLRLAGNLLRGIGLLCKGGSLSGAAADAGFSDYSHFARTLGKACGFRPPVFQRMMASLDLAKLQAGT